jgi:hypothetical protein
MHIYKKKYSYQVQDLLKRFYIQAQTAGGSMNVILNCCRSSYVGHMLHKYMVLLIHCIPVWRQAGIVVVNNGTWHVHS